MGSLLDDRPHRKMVSLKESSEQTIVKKVLLFTKPAFFCKRDRDMKPEQEISQRVIDDVRQTGAHCVVLVVSDDDWMKEQLTQAGLDLFYINSIRPVVSAKSLKNYLVKLGVQFSYIRDFRQVTWLNMSKFTVNNILEVIRQDDYAKLGIKPDKEVTFQDMANDRKRGAWL